MTTETKRRHQHYLPAPPEGVKYVCDVEGCYVQAVTYCSKTEEMLCARHNDGGRKVHGVVYE